MAGKSSQSNNRGPGLFGYFVSGKDLEHHTQQSAPTYVAPAYGDPQGITATGGVINDFVETGPGNVYRTHIFTSTGTFNVTNNSGSFGDTVEYLVVAGGGSGEILRAITIH